MATGTYPSAASTNEVATSSTSQAVFIPEVWSNEIYGEMMAMLVARNAVRVMNHRGKRGDVVHIPTPERQGANAKAEHSAVTLINNTEPEQQVLLNNHYEYSKLIEDIASVQGISTMRQWYTEEAAFAISKTVDSDVWSTFKAFGTSDGVEDADGAVIGSDGSTAWNGSNEAALADAGIRKAIQTLDDEDMPMSERSIMIPPVAKNSIFAIDKFVTQSNVGEVGRANTIRNGIIGDIYGCSVRVSSQSPYLDSAARAVAVLHASAVVLIEQVGVRVQAQYKLEHLANLLTADALWGAKCIKPTSGSGGGQGGVLLAVPA